jgi:hypothetical protein
MQLYTVWKTEAWGCHAKQFGMFTLTFNLTCYTAKDRYSSTKLRHAVVGTLFITQRVFGL